MNFVVGSLIGYAIKELVIPAITESSEPQQSTSDISLGEIESALSDSKDTLKMVTSLLDIFA